MASSTHSEDQNKYSFLDQESQQPFYLETDDNNEFIKLGDGTFGVVFAASNRLKKDKLAVKILYEYSAPGMSNVDLESIPNEENTQFTPYSIKKRFENELKSTQHILEQSNDPNLICVIKIVGWTKKFKESNLYKELQQKFSYLKLSDYALVTERYDHTLKTLLEGGIGWWTYLGNKGEPAKSRQELEEEIKKQKNSHQELEKGIERQENSRQELEKEIEGQEIYELTGYDILRQKTFEDRIATILPYLIDIAQGLSTLHKAHLCHLDLKPANIFVKKDGIYVKSVIGDLGFLYPGEQPKFEALPVANLQLPLGTRHYRSPEQKDYFEICDVEVQVPNGEGNKLNNDIQLITYDPKLRDTIIEDDDYIVFSKNKKSYPIKSILIDYNSDNSPIHITIPNCTKGELINDKKTQVLLYKRQTYRTDLFGFGAILYDLLTCGESPEKFYENIRVIYDKEGKDVNDIMEDYQKVSNFQSTEPSLVQVFEQFKLNKNSSSYAPSDIVQIILQCMLYKADSTFYSLSKGNNASSESEQENAVSILLTSLLKLGYERKNENNSLIIKEWNNAQHSSNTGFLDQIRNLQEINKENLWERLAKGVWYLDKISLLVEDLLKPDEFLFSELLPTNFAISEKNNQPNALNIKYNLYKTKESYKKDLKSDFLYTKITRDIGNPFVPNYLAFIRRKIRLITKDKGKNNITYNFLDSSVYEDIIKENDWIILKSKNNDITLAKVKKVEQDLSTLSLSSEDNEDIDINQYEFNNKEYVYYQNIDLCVYYFNVIGIYIYQIFFVDLDKNTASTPKITDIIYNQINEIKIMNSTIRPEIKIAGFIKTENKPFLERWNNKKNTEESEKFEEIIKLIVYIYLKLTFHQSKDSYYGRTHNNLDAIYLLSKDIDQLKKLIDDATKTSIKNFPVKKFDPFKTELLEVLKPFDQMAWDMISVLKP